MKKRPSIQEIFKNWQKFTLLALVILILLTLSSLIEGNSFSKSANLMGQKALVNEVVALGREDLNIANIQYRGHGEQLLIDYDKLLGLRNMDVFGNYILGYAAEYATDLGTLKERIERFNASAAAWYDPSESDLDAREQQLQQSRYALLSHIDTMLFRNIGYDYQQFGIRQMMIFASLALCALILVYYALRFRIVFKDIHSLYAIETSGREPHQIVTDEIDVISKRMNRKPTATDNPALIDPVTEINNYKGLVTAFANRKSKDGASLAVCVISVDGFKELDKQHPKSFTQMVLKKIAFMLSLHEQHTDILARTDYCEFTLVLSRANMSQILEECDNIRKSVEETAFKVPKGNTIHLTISGGLTQKSGQVSIEESVELARDVLAKAQRMGTNSIKQPKDVVSV